jgi:UDP-GlcNAc3NAcA epimerase
MTRILTIIGARPQFIKAAPVSRAIAATPGLEEILVHTGQHFDHNMSRIFFDQMGIPRPKYNLDIHSLSHGAMTGQMLEACEQVMLDEKPDWVMVYGDTNSTLAGALSAAKLGIRVAHVEAGLRSFNMSMPEEINRILTDRVTNLLFCPTQTAVFNLLDEGFERFKAEIMLTGDVMYDACLLFSEKSTPPAGLNLPGQFALATVHRAENTDDPSRLDGIVRALNQVGETMPVYTYPCAIMASATFTKPPMLAPFT